MTTCVCTTIAATDQFVEGHTQDLTNVLMNDFCSNSAFYDFLCEVEKYEGGER